MVGCATGAGAGADEAATPMASSDEQHGHGHGRGHAADHDGGHGHPHQAHGPHRFESADEWAPVFEDPARAQWQRPEAVIDRVAPERDAAIAVVGAGTGYFATRFAKRFPAAVVYANDVEPDMVRHLGERAAEAGLENLRPVQGDANDPALPTKVDVAFMCNVYHHIEKPEVFFGHLAADLEPGARLFIVEFKPEAAGDDVPGPPPEMRVSATQVANTLAPLGFTQVAVDQDLLPYQYVLELRGPPD